jgi:hypothetical protein
MHHVDRLPVTKRRETGAQHRRLTAADGDSHDQRDSVSGLDDVDELPDWLVAERVAHELDCLLTIAASSPP